VVWIAAPRRFLEVTNGIIVGRFVALLWQEPNAPLPRHPKRRSNSSLLQIVEDFINPQSSFVGGLVGGVGGVVLLFIRSVSGVVLPFVGGGGTLVGGFVGFVRLLKRRLILDWGH
jgi:hypothetical protein